jgi:hypothetical protein
VITPRRGLAAILLISLVGTEAELVLLKHTESGWQWIPLILIPLLFAAVVWRLADRRRASLIVLLVLATLSLVSGGLGVILHYRGNVEFALERSPELIGWALLREAIAGATPTLAPGVMVQLGLLGWLFAVYDGAVSPPSELP